MKMISLCTTNLTDAQNWQALWGKEKYLLSSLTEKLKNKIWGKEKYLLYEK